MAPRRRVRCEVALLLAALLAAPSASALTCTHPAGAATMPTFGDVNASGDVNVADVICVILVTLAELASDPLPSCLDAEAHPVPVLAADLDCSGAVDVADAMVGTAVVLGTLPEGVPADEGGCPAACVACSPPGASSCLVAGACLPDGELHPTDPCLACDGAVDPIGLSVRPNGASCGVGQVCMEGSCEEDFATQFEHTFTTCGSTGRLGPSLSNCQSAYSGAPHLDIGTLDVVGGIQRWTVPATGAYTITAAGASGGGPVGGDGAVIRGTFTLTQGTQLRILVGQMGSSAGTNDHGGGGGSFVTLADDSPLVVAGGGGGAFACCGQTNAQRHGRTHTTGGHSVGSNTSGGVPGGANGQGGQSHDCCGNGGGGMYGTGLGGSGGEAYVLGGRGGSNSGSSGADGGFGAGSASTSTQRTGGGGGYSGGGGARGNSGSNHALAGGGGSFIAASATSAGSHDGTFTDASSADAGYSGPVANIGPRSQGQGWVTITAAP